MFDSQHRTIQYAAIYVAYFVVWLLGWFMSTQLESITNLASIFIPAGIRISFLLLCRQRLWPAIILADISAAIGISLYFGRFGAPIEMLIASSAPILTYACSISIYQRGLHPEKEDVDRFILLFLVIGVTSVINSSILIGNSLYWQSIPKDSVISLWAAFALGDFIGVLLVTPLIVVAYNQRNADLTGIKLKLSLIALILAAFTFAGLFLYFKPEAFTYIKLMMFGVIILVAYHYGWIAVLVTAWLTTIVLSLYTPYISSQADTLEAQIFIITLALTGFLLSSALLEKQKHVAKLIAKNKELIQNKEAIKAELAQNQALANKLVISQEAERMHISREMHDEVGQNITALKTNIRVIQSLNKDPKVQPVIDIIYDLAESIYKISYDIMYRLRPVTLNQLGLTKSLQTSAFTGTLDAANTKYNVSLAAGIDELEEHVQSAIYRIVQETMNNAVKYANARSFNVTLRFKADRLFLHIWDDGKGFDVNNQKTGVGISGIEERVYALKGQLRIYSTARGTGYHIGFRS